jgi:hypothetical protein
LGFATTAEGAQEALAASLQNVIEQGYNPEQLLQEGVAEAGGYGAGVGGTVELLLQFIGGRKRRRAEDVTETEDTGSGEGAPVDPSSEQRTEELTDTARTGEAGAAGLDTADTTVRLDDVGKGTKDDTLDAKKDPVKPEEKYVGVDGEAQNFLLALEDAPDLINAKPNATQRQMLKRNGVKNFKELKEKAEKTPETPVETPVEIKKQEVSTELAKAEEGFDAAFSGKKEAAAKPVEEVDKEITLSPADKRAKDTYRLNLKNRYYLDSDQKSEDLDKFNKALKVEKPDTPVLSEEDKNKVVDLIQSNPKKGTADYKVAQTLSKDPVVENVLDNAAFMVEKGRQLELKDFRGKKIDDIKVPEGLTAKQVRKYMREEVPVTDAGYAYSYADGNQGKAAGSRVSTWVNKNLSKEGRDWFNSRVEAYEKEKDESTEGILRAERKDKGTTKTETATEIEPVAPGAKGTTLAKEKRLGGTGVKPSLEGVDPKTGERLTDPMTDVARKELRSLLEKTIPALNKKRVKTVDRKTGKFKKPIKFDENTIEKLLPKYLQLIRETPEPFDFVAVEARRERAEEKAKEVAEVTARRLLYEEAIKEKPGDTDPAFTQQEVSELTEEILPKYQTLYLGHDSQKQIDETLKYKGFEKNAERVKELNYLNNRIYKKKELSTDERKALIRHLAEKHGILKTRDEIDQVKELTGDITFGDENLDAGREEGFVETKLGKDEAGKEEVRKLTDVVTGIYKLARNAVIDMTYTLPVESMGALRQGDLVTALRSLAENTNNSSIKRIANKMADKVGNTKVIVTPDLFLDGNPYATFNPKTNTIELDSILGMNTHVLLHEMTHALTSAELSNPSSPTTKQLKTIYEKVKDRIDTAYGTENLDDFVAETFSNPAFQQKLAKLSVDGEPITALQKFANIIVNIIRRIAGYSPIDKNAYTATSDIIESMLAPAPAYRDAGKYNIGPAGVSKLLSGLGKRQGDKEYLNPQQQEGFLNKATEFLRDAGVAGVAKDAFLGLGDLLTITKLAEKNGYEGIGDRVNESISKQRGLMEIAGEEFDKIAKEISEWSTANPEQKKILDDVIYNLKYGATIYQVDPTLDAVDAARRYNINSEQMDAWAENQEQWAKLEESGRNIYKKMRDYYKREYNKLLNILDTQLKEAVGEEAATKIKNKHFSRIFDGKILDVYFPLTREGEYLVQYKRKQPEKEGDPFVTVTLQTQSGAEELVKSLNADKDEVEEGSVRYIGKQGVSEFMRTPPPNSFVSDIMEATSNISNAVEQSAFKEELVRLYINTLPETSYAKSLAKRKERPGFIPDSLHAFRDKGFTLSRQVIQLQKGKEIRGLEADVRKRIKEIQNEPFKERTLGQRIGISSDTGVLLPSRIRVGQELLRRTEFARKGPNSKTHEAIARTANQTAFVYTIGFNASSAIVNLSQIPLMVYPFIGAEHGYTRSAGALKDAYIVTGNGKVDLTSYYNIGRTKDADGNEVLTYTVRDEVPKLFSKKLGRGNRKLQEGEKRKMEAFAPLVKEADARGQLTRSWVLESLGLGEAGRAERMKNLSPASRLHNITMGLSAYMFNTAERLNRQSTLLATYELALRKAVEKKEPRIKKEKYEFHKVFKLAQEKYPELIDAAVNKSIEDTQRLNGGTVLETAPRLAQQSFGRVAMMYKSFGLRMYTTMIQAAREVANKELTPGERYIAFKQLAGVHGSALFFAGVHGLPLYGAIEMAFNMLLLEDDEDDFDTLVRKSVGEEWFKGAINLGTGIDIASRTRLTGLLIQENRFNSDASLEENILFYMGGPAFSTVQRFIRAGNDIKDGQLERGVENFMPAGLTKFWQGTFGRIAREGYMSRRGDVIYGDPSATELAGVVFGFSPAEYIIKQERNNQKNRIDKNVSKERTRILKNLYVGMRTFDMPMYEAALEDLFEFNEKHPLAAIVQETVHRSMEGHKRTTKNIARNNGLNISPSNRYLIFFNELGYDDDYKFFFA